MIVDLNFDANGSTGDCRCKIYYRLVRRANPLTGQQDDAGASAEGRN